MSRSRSGGDPRTQEHDEHLDGVAAEAFVLDLEVSAAAEAHLRTGCDACHERIQAAFDRVLVAIETGSDDRDVRAWLKSLGGRFSRRHLCPLTLVEDLASGDERARRHLRHCPYCADELAGLDQLSRPSSPRRRRSQHHRPRRPG